MKGSPQMSMWKISDIRLDFLVLVNMLFSRKTSRDLSLRGTMHDDEALILSREERVA
jgi:hypothetical protein